MSEPGRISPWRTLFAAVIALPFLLPFLFLAGTALRPAGDFAANPGGWPAALTLEHLSRAWQDAHLGRALGVTLVISLVACMACLALALPAAFWFRLNRGALPGLLRHALVAAYAIPTVVWLIPLFVILSRAGLAGNILVAGVVNGVASVPFAIQLLHGFLCLAASDDMLDAAALDGASPARAFIHIGLPLARPAIASVVVLVFAWTFGEILVAATLLQPYPQAYTMTLAATTLATRESVNLQGQAAVALVSLAPVMLIFALTQRRLAAGFRGLAGG